MSDTRRLVILIGSVREGRFGPVVTAWVAARARDHGAFDVDVVDLAGVELPLRLPALSPKAAGHGYPRPEAMRDLTERLDAADAFVAFRARSEAPYPG